MLMLTVLCRYFHQCRQLKHWCGVVTVSSLLAWMSLSMNMTFWLAMLRLYCI